MGWCDYQFDGFPSVWYNYQCDGIASVWCDYQFDGVAGIWCDYQFDGIASMWYNYDRMSVMNLARTQAVNSHGVEAGVEHCDICVWKGVDVHKVSQIERT